MRRPRGWTLAVLTLLALPGASARAFADEISPEVGWATERAGDGLSTNTGAAEHLVYYHLYGGVSFAGASLVNYREEGDSSGSPATDVRGAQGGTGGGGLAFWPPGFDYVGFEEHIEFATVNLRTDFGPRMVVAFQHGFTVRGAVPLRYVQPYVAVGPNLSILAPDGNQFDVDIGLRLGSGLNFFAGRHVRFFFDYRYDLYGDVVGQSPRAADDETGLVPERLEIDGLAVHSLVTGIDFNTPSFLESTPGWKFVWLLYTMIPILPFGTMLAVALANS